MTTTLSPRRKAVGVAVVWLVSLALCAAVITGAWFLLPVAVAQGGLGLLAIVGCVGLVAWGAR